MLKIVRLSNNSKKNKYKIKNSKKLLVEQYKNKQRCYNYTFKYLCYFNKYWIKLFFVC